MSAVSPAFVKLEHWVLPPHIRGRIDHFAADLKRGLLIVNAIDANATLLLDLSTGHVVHEITDVSMPQGAAIFEKSVVIANKDDTVRCIALDDYRQLAIASVRPDADNVRVDAANGRVLVGYGDDESSSTSPLPYAGLVELNARTLEFVAVTALPAHAESFQCHSDGVRAFVNVPKTAHGAVVCAVDRRTCAVTAQWQLHLDGRKFERNYPMALLEKEGVLLIGCRAPPSLVALDFVTGVVRAAVETVEDADDVWFDAALQRAYVTGGGGAVAAYQLQFDSDGSVRTLALPLTPTGVLARTSIFVPALRRLFVAVPQLSDADPAAAVAVFEPAPL